MATGDDTALDPFPRPSERGEKGSLTFRWTTKSSPRRAAGAGIIAKEHGRTPADDAQEIRPSTPRTAAIIPGCVVTVALSSGPAADINPYDAIPAHWVGYSRRHAGRAAHAHGGDQHLHVRAGIAGKRTQTLCGEPRRRRSSEPPIRRPALWELPGYRSVPSPSVMSLRREFAGVTANPGETAARGHARLRDDMSSPALHAAWLSQQNFRRRVSCLRCRVNPAQLVKHRLAGHGGWQTGGVEPVAEVSAAGRGGRAGQRGRYGIDGGFAGPAVFGVIEAGLAGTMAWAARHRRPAVAALVAWAARRRRVSGEFTWTPPRSTWWSAAWRSPTSGKPPGATGAARGGAGPAARRRAAHRR